MSPTDKPDERMEAAIEQALRGGDPDDAGRAEIQQRLRTRTKR
jgi:hypothetical protein